MVGKLWGGGEEAWKEVGEWYLTRTGDRKHCKLFGKQA
jgi:hypothetical protein